MIIDQFIAEWMGRYPRSVALYDPDAGRLRVLQPRRPAQEQGQGRVVVAAQPASQVLVQHLVQGGQDLVRHGPGEQVGESVLPQVDLAVCDAVDPVGQQVDDHRFSLPRPPCRFVRWTPVTDMFRPTE